MFTVALATALSSISFGAESQWTNVTVPSSFTNCVIRPIKTPGGVTISVEMGGMTVESKRIRLKCDGKTFELVADETGMIYDAEKITVLVEVGSAVTLKSASKPQPSSPPRAGTPLYDRYVPR